MNISVTYFWPRDITADVCKKRLKLVHAIGLFAAIIFCVEPISGFLRVAKVWKAFLFGIGSEGF